MTEMTKEQADAEMTTESKRYLNGYPEDTRQGLRRGCKRP
jgi:hypothetical protein